MKTWKIAAITAAVSVVALAALGGGIAYAQSGRPGWGTGGYGGGMMGGGYGGGMMGGYGGSGDYGWMGSMYQWMFTSGAGSVHTLVWNGLAKALNLTPEQLNTELASGKTLAQVAEAQGVSREQLAAALETSVRAGLNQAVADGVLTREQADAMLAQMGGNFEWMLDHMGAAGFGPGACHGLQNQGARWNFAPQSGS